MSIHLFHRPLDEDLFPELQFRLGHKGVRALLLPPAGDARVPARPSAPVLLVVFRLDQPALPTEPHADLPEWTLSFDRRDAVGRPVREQVAVVAEPRDGNDAQRPRPGAGPPSPGQVIYRGAWWTDLTRAYAGGLLKPGMSVEVAYAEQPEALLVLA